MDDRPDQSLMHHKHQLQRQYGKINGYPLRLYPMGIRGRHGVHDVEDVHDEDDHVAYSCGHLIPFFHSDAHAFLL